jgi:hypothetical protein
MKQILTTAAEEEEKQEKEEGLEDGSEEIVESSVDGVQSHKSLDFQLDERTR